jgi:hypothetical protein
MAVDARTKQILWSKAAGRCSFPDCRKPLVHEASEQDREVLVGEVAHIVAQKPDGPRGDRPPPGDSIDGYANLLLLCHEHHEIVDQQVATYPVEKLVQFRTDHEDWVRTRLSGDERFSGLAKPENLVTENVYCTLLPVSEIPHFVFSAPCTLDETTVKQQIKMPDDKRVMAPFIIRGGRLYAFNDLREPDSPFAMSVDSYTAENHNAPTWWSNPDNARWYMELLNRTLNKLTGRHGLKLDKEHHRYYFEPDGPGQEKKASYKTITGRQSTHRVAWNPRFKHNGEAKKYWEHFAVGLRFHHIGERSWVFAIRPERRFTTDGFVPLQPKSIGRRSTKLKSRMFNLDLLGEVQFWRDFLSDGSPRIAARFGSQNLVIENTLLHTQVAWPQIANDEANRLTVAYEEDLFTLADKAELSEFEESEVDDEDFDETGEREDAP